MCACLKGLSTSLQTSESGTVKELLFKLIDFLHTNSLSERRMTKPLETKMVQTY